ncbi:ATP-dependent zinc protease family protein [Algoriphagus formosus]|uniref:ATP-dependent zinc protease n=1 Tax=Algoriphagus formosus TaxID=2007308 RepID=A0A4R5VCA1_9BACT|nr:RimK/LysX family protein [Algoriphagus aquimaris]TDK49938.1 ATP-dependent zinc protease [Algoriphagus aquimaris]
MSKQPKTIIGRKERISLPGLGLDSVWAKVDTGAYTSALHAEHIRLEEKKGKEVLVFQVLMSGHKKFTGEEVVFENFREKKVKNSFGQAEIRYLIETELELGGKKFQAEFTLTDRSKMKNAILLGRKILKGRFLVDVDSINLSKNQKSIDS